MNSTWDEAATSAASPQSRPPTARRQGGPGRPGDRDAETPTDGEDLNAARPAIWEARISAAAAQHVPGQGPDHQRGHSGARGRAQPAGARPDRRHSHRQPSLHHRTPSTSSSRQVIGHRGGVVARLATAPHSHCSRALVSVLMSVNMRIHLGCARACSMRHWHLGRNLTDEIYDQHRPRPTAWADGSSSWSGVIQRCAGQVRNDAYGAAVPSSLTADVARLRQVPDVEKRPGHPGRALTVARSCPRRAPRTERGRACRSPPAGIDEGNCLAVAVAARRPPRWRTRSLRSAACSCLAVPRRTTSASLLRGPCVHPVCANVSAAAQACLHRPPPRGDGRTGLEIAAVVVPGRSTWRTRQLPDAQRGRQPHGAATMVEGLDPQRVATASILMKVTALITAAADACAWAHVSRSPPRR